MWGRLQLIVAIPAVNRVFGALQLVWIPAILESIHQSESDVTLVFDDGKVISAHKFIHPSGRTEEDSRFKLTNIVR